MLRTELLELIRNGENSGIEFKEDALQPQDLAREAVCFANSSGGQILLGVADDGTIGGLTRENLEEWVMSCCRDKIRPEIIPYYEVVKDAAPGKDVAIVQVERGADVHALWHNNRRSYLIRVGTTCRELGAEELARLFQRRGALRAELRPIVGSGIDDLDIRRLRDYFGRIRQQPVPDDRDVDGWTTLLSNTELVVEEDGRAPATMAGLLLFGLNPKRLLPQAGIDAVAYPGPEKEYAARERAQLKSCLTFLGNSDGNLVETGLIELAVDFVRRNTGLQAHLEDGARRVERTTYPEEAVREAVVNAMIHRDYQLSNVDVELSVYSDRIEIVSPGRLPNGITPERMLVGIRASRNQLIVDTMRDYGYVEHMGMGVPRKIVRSMMAHNGKPPELREEDERFVLTLHA